MNAPWSAATLKPEFQHALSALRLLSLLLHDGFNFVSEAGEMWPLLKVVRPALLHQTVHLEEHAREDEPEIFNIMNMRIFQEMCFNH